MLDAYYLWAVRLHCLDNREDSVLEISALAQVNFHYLSAQLNKLWISEGFFYYLFFYFTECPNFIGIGFFKDVMEVAELSTLYQNSGRYGVYCGPIRQKQNISDGI